MNAQKKLYLLPHRCQLIGWILIGFSLVFVVCSILILKNEHEQFTYAAGGMIISFIGLLLAGLSREKQEDEFIRHIRVRTLIYFVIVCLIIGYVHSLSENMYQVYLMRSMKTISYIGAISLLILRLVSWLPFAAVVYSLVLRKVLSNNLKESGNEE